jgi:hypothetical protein
MSRSGRCSFLPIAGLRFLPISAPVSIFSRQWRSASAIPCFVHGFPTCVGCLDRKRGKLGLAAIAAYTDTVQKTDDGTLEYRFAANEGPLQHEARDYLLRALQIGRAVGWGKPETIAARNLVKRLRALALAERELIAIQWFSELDLDVGVSDPAEVGGSLDSVLATVSVSRSGMPTPT